MSETLLDYFFAPSDPRLAWKVVYSLPNILLIVLRVMMAGAEDFGDIERWGARRKLDFLRRFLPFEKAVRSHDALNDVINALLAALFAECFTNWVESLRSANPTSSPSTLKIHAALMARIARGFLWFRPGRHASVSCSGRKPSPFRSAGAARTARRARHHRRHGLHFCEG